MYRWDQDTTQATQPSPKVSSLGTTVKLSCRGQRSDFETKRVQFKGEVGGSHLPISQNYSSGTRDPTATQSHRPASFLPLLLGGQDPQ